eukprot:TRINITY_DN52_c1_g1_i2.p1 TRINITY_DN52_c1_g1~~TRINITY_DN52_c1_g1_i2.p1  ORF type:complete len:1141 (+),score=375.16 TRINITY_DN52_c1_g1_i2:113-3535(+)
MRPFESIKFKHPSADFAPNSSRFRPSSKFPPRTAPTWAATTPGAAGAGGRAVQLKKQLGPAWDAARVAATHPPPKRPVLLPAGQKVRVQVNSPRSDASPDRARIGSPGAVSASPRPGHVAAAAARGERPQSPLAYQLTASDARAVSPHAFVTPGAPLAFRPPLKSIGEPPVPVAGELPARPEGISVQELCPVKRAPPNLRSIDLSEAVPDPDDAPVATPRFSVPQSVEVGQGSGPQIIEGFARNLDADAHGVDQALCYNVWAHSADVFTENGLPTVDCTGTLFFTPSSHYGGSTLVTLTLSDNAAVAHGEVKTSLPQTFSINVTPAPVPVPRPVDWRSHQSKRGMAVAVVTDPAVAQEAEPQEVSVDRWTFPPANLHKLRSRRRVKGHQDLPLRIVIGACPLECILSPQMAQDRLALSGGGRIDVSAASEQMCRKTLEQREAEVGSKYSPELLPALGALAAIYFTWGGSSLAQCRVALSRIIDIYGVECGIVDDEDLSSVPRSTSLVPDPTLDADRLRRQSLDDKIAKTERYAEALMDLGRFHLIVGEYSDAAKAVRRALAVVRRMHGEDHRAYVRGALSLVEILCTQGLASEAFECSRKMRGAAELTFSHQDTTFCSCVHINAYCGIRAPEVLESADGPRHFLDEHRRALATRRTHDDNSTRLIESLLFTADACMLLGLWDEAQGHAQEAVDIGRMLTPGEAEAVELSLAPACLMLSHVCMLRSRYKGVAGAVPHLEQACKAATDAEGPHSVFATYCIMVFGAFMVGQAEDGPGEGLDMLEEASKALSQRLHSHHPLLARCRAATAAALLRSAQTLTKHERRQANAMLDKCSALLHQSRDALRVSLGAKHLLVAFTDELLCDLALHRKDSAAALSHVENARAARECDSAQTDGVGAPGNSGQALRIQSIFVEMVMALSAPVDDAVIGRYYDMTQLCSAVYGEQDAHVVEPLQNLAELHFRRGEYDRTHHYLARALSVVDSQNMHFLLGNLFRPASQLKAAEVEERNRLASERMTPQQCQVFGILLSQIATTYEAQKRLREAESSYMQTLATFEIAQAATHLGVCYALDGLARLLHHQGMHGDALSYFEKAATLRSDAHPTLTEEQKESQWNIAVVDTQLRLLGYQLLRHQAPSKYPVYI